MALAHNLQFATCLQSIACKSLLGQAIEWRNADAEPQARVHGSVSADLQHPARMRDADIVIGLYDANM
jgi:hypothetical protein